MILENKNVIVAGGSGFLGSAMVRGLQARGAHLFTIDKEGFPFDRISPLGKEINSIELDLTNQSAVENFVADFNNPVDCLINCCGFIHNEPIVSMGKKEIIPHSMQAWKTVLDVNLTSVFLLSSLIISKMVSERTKGCIVNVSSISAAGQIGQSAYSASKSAIEALTKSWAKELGPIGIRCFGVAPGFFDVGSTIQHLPRHQYEEIKGRTPLRRFGKDKEFTSAVISLIENDYFNGKIMELDGGLTL